MRKHDDAQADCQNSGVQAIALTGDERHAQAADREYTQRERIARPNSAHQYAIGCARVIRADAAVPQISEYCSYIGHNISRTRIDRESLI
jgi:hypothetical protein